MSVSIRISDLSKQFLLRNKVQSYYTIRDSLKEMMSLQFLSGKQKIDALKNINLEIEQGSVVGLIGNNGAGKSTLLKVLARIIPPSKGRVEYYGSITPLLEVGTGFHPELTGRENIFLSGSILGMSKQDIRSKFDEIVAFSEMETFLDMPVKNYSSGMYTRLAFSVAAHLRSEIILIDEILAVGDTKFQKKCLNKMENIGENGRTVIFVSHSMPAITRLCSRAVWIDQGTIKDDGPSSKVVTNYLVGSETSRSSRAWEPNLAPGDATVSLLKAEVKQHDMNDFDIRKPIQITMTYRIHDRDSESIPNIHVYNEAGVCIFVSMDFTSEWKNKKKTKGTYQSTVEIPGNYLAEGIFYIGFAITSLSPFAVHVDEKDLLVINVIDTMDGDSSRGTYQGEMAGVTRPKLPWTIQKLS